jgi:hypothetical protein
MSLMAMTGGGAHEIDAWCNSVKRPRFVVQCSARVPTRSGKENLCDSDYQALARLKKIADDWQLAILVLHHLSKRCDTDVPIRCRERHQRHHGRRRHRFDPEAVASGCDAVRPRPRLQESTAP